MSLSERSGVGSVRSGKLTDDKVLVQMPYACGPTTTSSAIPASETCIWANSRSESQSTPTVAALQERNAQLLKQLRNSVSRIHELSQSMSRRDNVVRGAADEVDLTATPARGVSLLKENHTIYRGSLSLSTGQENVPDPLRHSDAGALYSQSVETGGRCAKVLC